MSVSGRMDIDIADSKSSHRERERSSDTRKSHRSSHRSRSRERERRHRHDDDRERRKRSRSRDRERDKDRERDSHRSSSHRDKDRDRERRRDGDRDRDRDRDRHRERDRRDRDGGRDRERDKERDRDREDRRRKREDENGDTERAKRKRPDEEPISPIEDNIDEPRDRDRPEPRRRGGRSPQPFLPPVRRPSPAYAAPQEDYNPDAEPKEDDSEARSVFVSQLAARLTARDLGYFFEDKLGEGSVMDARIVTDRISRRSKGIGYVEMKNIELVDKAINLSGTVVMGLPIKVQHTEAERNRTHAGEGNLNLPPGVTMGSGPLLYVGSLHFNLTENDIKQVFEPFGELDFVDLHRDPATGRSKGYCFIQYKRPEDAKMALEQMEGFELAGRQLRVNTVHEKGTAVRYSGAETLDDGSGGGNLNAASRQALMQKLARTETPTTRMDYVPKPNIASTLQTKCVLLTNMFNPAEESEADWDKELASDVKEECQSYGKVDHIKVERDSQGEIYVQFDSVDAAKGAINGLNGRWFGGKQISATFIPDAIMQAHK